MTRPLSSFIEQIPLPIMLIGYDQNVVAANGRLRALLGDHVLGRHFITALRQPSLIEAIEGTLSTKKPAQALFLGRDGERDTTYLVSIAAEPDVVVLSFEDRSAAEDVNTLRRDFVANVSHELRTPLTALLGFVETLKGAARDDPAARDRFLDIMAREAGRMTRLVDDLLSLSRVEETERVRPQDEVDLNGLVTATLTEMQPVLDQAQARVSVALPEDAVRVPGDPGQLRQVLVNLIENAGKYGAREGTIDVRLTQTAFHPLLRAPGVEIIVQNDGDGIAAHHIPRLTERFYRVDGHRSREVGGTGLGLAIVKHIIGRHRGRFVIESEPGQGVTARIVLPARLRAKEAS